MQKTGIDTSLFAGVVVLGFSAIVTQTILLREFLTVFSGNELVIGIVLANWMIITGVGSMLGRYADKAGNKGRLTVLLFLLIALLPPATVYSLYWFRHIILPAGVMAGIVECFVGSFGLLLPYCLVSGALFTMFAAQVSERSGDNKIAAVYSLESAGSVAGGVLFNVVLVFFFSTFQSLLLLALINIGACCVLAFQFTPRSYQVLIVSVGAILLLLASRLDLDTQAKRLLFPNQELVYQQDTPYGNIVITMTGEQLNFFENSSLLFANNDATANEDAVHFAMVQHPNPNAVLLIGGGISGTTDEILKYGVKKIHYVELNPSLIEIGRKFSQAVNDPRITVVAEDGRRFVRRSKDRYDVVLVNLPDPSTAQLNRYYTVQFARQVRAIMSPNGVAALSLLPSGDYSGTEARSLSSVIYHTLESQFAHVLVLPGLRNHYLASDAPLTTNVAERVAGRNISNVYVNRYYVDDELVAQRSEAFRNTLTGEKTVNEDFVPVAYYRHLRYWLSFFGTPTWVPGILLGLVVLAIAGRFNAVSLGMFTSGFAASGIEIVLLISFQIIYGYVYQATGAIVAVFMAGLACGSFLGQRLARPAPLVDFVKAQAGIGLFALFLPVVLNVLNMTESADAVVYTAFVVLTVLAGSLVGFVFSLGTKLPGGHYSRIASSLYSFDLVGAAVGALVCSIYLVPLLGIARSCTVIALVGLVGSVVGLFRRGGDPRPATVVEHHV